jgi:hypothetical protein
MFAMALGACGGGGGGGSGAPPQYSVGGTVAGLAGTGLQLQNGASEMSIAAAGAFTFPSPNSAGSTYSVTVAAQPSNPAQTCVITNGTGTVSANVTNISVQCTTNSYPLGGSVSGLAGTGLVLQIQGGDSLTISANGSFNFPKSVASGTSYSVTVSAQPTQPSQACTVSNGSGVVGSGDVTNIEVACSTIITIDNVAAVTELGNTTSEILMQFASFMGERLSYLNSHPGASVSETCSDLYHQFTAGTASYSFQDNDGSGSLTPGDVVTISLSGCLSQSMADHVSGMVTLTLVAPSTSPQAADLVFAAKAVLNGFQLSGLTLNGTVNAQYSAADTQYSVQAAVDASAVTFTYQLTGGFFPADTVLVSNAAVSKVIDYTVPRYSVQISTVYQSQQYGKFSVSTPTVLSGRLGIYPDVGTEVFSGGPSVLQYAAQNVGYNESVVASLDQTGSGNFVDVPGLFWEQGINGFAWWEPRGFSVVSVGARPSYTTMQLAMWQMQLLFTEPQEADPVNDILATDMDVDTPIKMFFNGPVDPATDAFTFNTASYLIPGQVTVPAVVAVNGPIATLTPQSQLQHGEPYQLSSVNRVATTWSTTGAGAYVSLQVTTLNNLRANAAPSPGVASPGQTVQLTSAGSLSTNSSITGYAWTQTGGTAVVLSGADTATASFVVPASAPAGSSLQFSLTITDANGETDSAPVTTFVLADLTQPFLYYRAQEVPSAGSQAEGARLESSLNGTITTVLDTTYDMFRFNFNGTSSSFDQAQFGPGVVPVVPGTYSSNTPSDHFYLTSLLCGASTTWTLTIHEAVAAPDGTASKFSGDFTFQCMDGIQPPYTGSIRVNSTWPLP